MVKLCAYVGVNTKILNVPQGTMEEVTRALCNSYPHLNEKKWFLQVFDSAWNEYIDLDSNDQLVENGKIRVVFLDQSPEKMILSDTACTFEMYSFNEPSTSSAVPYHALNISSLDQSSSQPETPSINNKAKPFPSKVAFLDFKYRTVLEISAKDFRLEKMSRATKTDILNVMSNFIMDYTLYPTSQQLTFVVDHLLTFQPSLSLTNSSTFSAKSYWLSLLRMKMRNSRRREWQQEEYIKSRREERTAKRTQKKENEFKELVNQREYRKYSLKNYSPDVSLPEDTAYLEHHHQLIIKEYEKRSPSAESISISIDVTFASRRKFVLSSTSPAEVLQIYPFLRESSQIVQEFSRLLGDNCETIFLNNLNKKGDKLVNLLRGVIQTEATKSRVSVEKENYSRSIGAIVSVIQFMRCNIDSFVLTECENECPAYPHILAPDIFEDEQVELYVDQHFLCHCRDGIEGVLCLIAVYYIFNIDVPSKFSRAFYALTKVFLDIQSSCNSERLMELIRKI